MGGVVYHPHVRDPPKIFSSALQSPGASNIGALMIRIIRIGFWGGYIILSSCNTEPQEEYRKLLRPLHYEKDLSGVISILVPQTADKPSAEAARMDRPPLPASHGQALP